MDRLDSECVCSSFFSVLINDSLKVDFQARRGLHHGDPLSLFLFILVVGGLAGLMKMLVP